MILALVLVPSAGLKYTRADAAAMHLTVKLLQFPIMPSNTVSKTKKINRKLLALRNPPP